MPFIRRAALIALLATLGAAANAQASTTTNLRQVSYGSNSFYNYDFDSKSAVATNVDWPVDLIFWGNATIGKVQKKLGWTWTGSKEFQRISSPAGTAWVASAGRKNTICTDTHYRLYAPAGGYFTDPWLGHYVIGTAHLDKNECGLSATYGWNETAEANVAARAAAVWGQPAVAANATILPDGVTSTLSLLGNANQTGWQGSHYFWNDGLPTLVRVR